MCLSFKLLSRFFRLGMLACASAVVACQGSLVCADDLDSKTESKSPAARPVPPRVTDLENQTFRLGLFDSLDELYDQLRSGEPPIGKIPERREDPSEGPGTLTITSADEDELGFDTSELDQIIADFDDLEDLDGDEFDELFDQLISPLSDEEYDRLEQVLDHQFEQDLGLPPLNEPPSREEMDVDDRSDGVETMVDLPGSWSGGSVEGGSLDPADENDPYRTDGVVVPDPSELTNRANRTDSDAGITGSGLQDDISIRREDRPEANQAETGSPSSGNSSRTRRRPQSTPFRNGKQQDLLDQILDERSADSGGPAGPRSSRPRSRPAVARRVSPSARSDTDLLLEEIAADVQTEVKRPGQNNFSIDDLFTVDIDKITDQPTVDDLLRGGQSPSEDGRYREQAANLVQRGNDSIERFRSQARERLVAQQRADLARRRAAQQESYRRQEQFSRQQAAQYDRWRREQYSQQQQLIFQQQMQRLQQQQWWNQRPTPRWNNTPYRPPLRTDGSLLGNQGAHGF